MITYLPAVRGSNTMVLTHSMMLMAPKVAEIVPHFLKAIVVLKVTLSHISFGCCLKHVWGRQFCDTWTYHTRYHVFLVMYVIFWHEFGFGPIRETSGTTDVVPFLRKMIQIWGITAGTWSLQKMVLDGWNKLSHCILRCFAHFLGYVLFLAMFHRLFSRIFNSFCSRYFTYFTTEPQSSPRVFTSAPLSSTGPERTPSRNAPRRQERGRWTVDGTSGTVFQWTMIGIDWIGLRQNLEENRRFHAKIHGFWYMFP